MKRRIWNQEREERSLNKHIPLVLQIEILIRIVESNRIIESIHNQLAIFNNKGLIAPFLSPLNVFARRCVARAVARRPANDGIGPATGRGTDGRSGKHLPASKATLKPEGQTRVCLWSSFAAYFQSFHSTRTHITCSFFSQPGTENKFFWNRLMMMNGHDGSGGILVMAMMMIWLLW